MNLNQAQSAEESLVESARPLRVFLTVDVELWPTSWQDFRSEFSSAFDRYILGRTAQGTVGLPYQLRMAKDHGLRFVFFVETLFACEFGLAALSEIVHMIQEAGQEVQLHAHPEWVRHASRPLIDTGERFIFRDFSDEEQSRLIEVALSNLTDAGAKKVRAFRAGSFQANAGTLRAVRNAGLPMDSSFKLGTTLDRESRIVVDRCSLIDGVVEYPLSVFHDWPGHRRHLQIGSCSSRELAHVLRRAHACGWESVVILSHSVEMMNRDRSKPDSVVLRRFERFCRFLADSSRDLRTSGFEAETGAETSGRAMMPIHSPPWWTLLRQGEQMSRRIRV